MHHLSEKFKKTMVIIRVCYSVGGQHFQYSRFAFCLFTKVLVQEWSGMDVFSVLLSVTFTQVSICLKSETTLNLVFRDA